MSVKQYIVAFFAIIALNNSLIVGQTISYRHGFRVSIAKINVELHLKQHN